MKLHSPVTLKQTIDTIHGPARVMLGSYHASDILAILLVVAGTDIEKERFDGEPIATISFNPEGPVILEEGQFCAKTWFENADLMNALPATGLFERTGRMVQAGYAVGEIWALKGAALEQFRESAAQQAQEYGDENSPVDSPSA